MTPHRSKALKNPRKKHRIKYGQAVVRRKGQVQEVRAQKETYGGEATGVRGKLTRSNGETYDGEWRHDEQTGQVPPAKPHTHPRFVSCLSPDD